MNKTFIFVFFIQRHLADNLVSYNTYIKSALYFFKLPYNKSVKKSTCLIRNVRILNIHCQSCNIHYFSITCQQTKQNDILIIERNWKGSSDSSLLVPRELTHFTYRLKICKPEIKVTVYISCLALCPTALFSCSPSSDGDISLQPQCSFCGAKQPVKLQRCSSAEFIFFKRQKLFVRRKSCVFLRGGRVYSTSVEYAYPHDGLLACYGSRDIA